MRLQQLADEDAEAYSAFARSPSAEARRRTIEVPEQIAACADEVTTIAGRLAPRLLTSVIGDAEAAATLAHAAAEVARRLAELNRRL